MDTWVSLVVMLLSEQVAVLTAPSRLPGGTKVASYPFGIMGMASKADCLQKGELVKFQLCTVTQTGQKMACHVVPQRRALVECVKDQVRTGPMPSHAMKGTFHPKQSHAFFVMVRGSSSIWTTHAVSTTTQ